MNDKEVKATKAATMTGSHIAKANTGASITLVNPTQGGMAELQVAAAGMSSGYVVQASSVLNTSTSMLSSDIGSLPKKGRGENHSYLESENPSNATVTREFVESAQTRFNAASAAFDEVKDKILSPQFGSADEAHQWFASFAQPITSKYGPEIGANIITDFHGSYWLEDVAISNRFSRNSGMGSQVQITLRRGDPTLAARTHTHPTVSTFSATDVANAALRGVDSYVSTPGASYRFSYNSYIKNSGVGMKWEEVIVDPRFVVPVKN